MNFQEEHHETIPRYRINHHHQRVCVIRAKQQLEHDLAIESHTHRRSETDTATENCHEIC